MAELATFEVPVRQYLRRDSAFAEAFSLPEDDPFHLSFGGSCSGLRADLEGDILFWFVERSGSGGVITSGVRELCNASFDDLSVSTSKHSEALDGTFYAFSVDGVGGTSIASLHLSIRGDQGSGEEHSFEYDSERHRLPADHLLLHVDEDAMGTYVPLQEASGFTIELTAQGVDLNEHAFMFALAMPIPVYGTVNGEPFEGTRVEWNGRAFSDRRHLGEATSNSRRITYLLESIPEELDFYLVALGEQ